MKNTEKSKVGDKASLNKAYNLPPEAGIALMTDRPELLKPFVAALRAGTRKLSPEEATGLVELLGDLLADRDVDRHEKVALQVKVMGFEDRIEKAVAALTKGTGA
jgi:hypothetical protein